ncbi:shikimate kinase [Owenweeksia hongkongensis DSM 17368]|uniref:Shikimate kinase n=1 Tax=Owenweeksia hongkongensis (strain DSM 17368 / CIP 108786 / JCM 12287 / NRRL B-23963 / UST20020801) TaxID=926562 RepID=G8QZR9_OWEHD|nr:shikimate kinase [Owenweeksia hongkongensis]AEV31513.1 shikimate kinase [Owenweeksia hongkongensis DSM 17368]
MKISLIGYMGSGKSTIGPELAVLSGLDYYDLDAEIEKHTGYTITETIFNKGELYFRKLEREKLHEILAKDNFVLSTGGGTPCYYDNIDVINKNSLSIYLQYNVKELFERLKGNTAERPLIAHLEGEPLQEYIGKHLFERSTYYDKATVVIKAGKLSNLEILKEIKNYTHE